jgi:hypothetical protein
VLVAFSAHAGITLLMPQLMFPCAGQMLAGTLTGVAVLTPVINTG